MGRIRTHWTRFRNRLGRAIKLLIRLFGGAPVDDDWSTQEGVIDFITEASDKETASPEAARELTEQLQGAEPPKDEHREVETVTQVSDQHAPLEASQFTSRMERFAGGQDEPGMFDITYRFSDQPRNNRFPKLGGGIGTYGAPHWTPRTLYEYLCQVYNNGEYFIDRYFDQSERYPWWGEFQKLKQTVRDSVKQKLSSATPFESWNDLDVWKDDNFQAETKALGERIRDDIIQRLSTGDLELQKFTLSPRTLAKRAKFPTLDPDHVFYASGQLIRGLNIYINMESA